MTVRRSRYASAETYNPRLHSLTPEHKRSEGIETFLRQKPIAERTQPIYEAVGEQWNMTDNFGLCHRLIPIMTQSTRSWVMGIL
jgi:hypothetical protein